MRTAAPFVPLFALGLALLAITPGAAQMLTGDVDEGHAYAREVCAACHQVERLGKSVKTGGPPAFQEVANDPAITELSLRVFLRTPHENMPNLRLEQDETDDIIAYILSLK